MSNQIDNLFKKKLKEHTVAPGPAAWSKISAAASKKNKTIVWLRIAAMLLLALSAWWLYNNTTPGEVSTVVEIAESNPNLIEDKTKEAEKENTDDLKTKLQPISPAQNSSKLTSKTQHKSELKEDKVLEIKDSKKEIEKEEMVALLDIPVQETQPIPAEETESVDKPIVIVYELKPYIKKTEPEPNLDPLLPKKNNLKKVLDVANDIRTGDSPLTGLRQAKEDLFALNFRKEEKKNNR